MESIVEINEIVIPEKKQGVSPVLVWFFIAMVLANIPGNMYGPLLPLYLKDLKAGVVEVGLFFTLSQIIPLVLQILGGWISDSLGRLRSIAMGSVAGVFSYIGLVLAPGWQWVLVGEGFSSMTRSLVGPSFGAFIAEHSEEKNRARMYSVSDMIMTIVLIVGPPLGGWLADQKSERLAIVFGFLLDSTSLVIFLAATDFIGYAASWAVLGLGIGLMSPAYQSLISKAIPEKVRGTAFGLMQTSLGIFSLPAPAVGAQLYDRGGPRLPFVITAILSVVTIIPVWLKFRLQTRTAIKSSDSTVQ